MQIAYSLLLFIAGSIFARLFVKSGLFPLVTGYLWGVSLSVLPSFASLLLFGGVRMPFYYCCSTVMVVILFSLGLKRGLFRPKFCLSMALGALVLTFLAVLFARYNYSVGSTDSASYVQTGLRFFTGAPVDVGQTFSSVGTWLSLAHGPVALWGDEYYYLLHPLLFTSLCALFFLLFFEIRSWERRPGEALLWLLFAGWVLSSFFVLFHVFYVHTNMPSGIYLFLAFSCYVYALKREDAAFLPLFSLAMFAFSLLRVEAPFFVASAILFSGVFYDDFRGISTWWLYVLVLPIAVWDLRIVWLLNGNEGLAGPVLLGAQALGLLVLPALIQALKKVGINRRQLQRWALISLCVVVFILSLVRFDSFAVNIASVFSNFFFTGRWGSLFWGGLFLLLVLVEDLRRDMISQLFIPYATFYFLGLLLLGFMRVPYRLGWGDSLNRMMIAIVPLLLYYLYNTLHQVVFDGTKRHDAENKQG